MADQVRIVIIFYNPNMGGTADLFVPFSWGDFYFADFERIDYDEMDGR